MARKLKKARSSLLQSSLSDHYTIRAVDRALDLLELLCGSGESISLHELSKRLARCEELNIPIVMYSSPGSAKQLLVYLSPGDRH